MPDIIAQDMDRGILNLVATRVFGVPLMVAPGKLAAIVDAIGPRLGLARGAAEAGLEAPSAAFLAEVPAVRAEIPGRIETRTPYAMTEEGIAVISVAGTLVHRSAAQARPWSGMRAYGDIEAEFRAAMEDRAVAAVMLDINSGGGEVTGAFELAQAVFEARGTKPVWAVADAMALSAAYLLASAADRVVLPETGMVGSVGVIATFRDVSARDEMEGLKFTSIFFGARKNDFNPHEPLSRKARADLQAGVDRWGEKFVATVARHRKGMTPDTVRATEAGIFEGVDGMAVEAGLADQVMPFREALGALGETARRARMGPGLRMGAAAAASRDNGQNTEVAMSDDKRAAETQLQPGAAATQAGNAQQAAPAAAAQQQGGQVVDLNAARGEGYAQAEQIVNLCVLAGAPEKAADLIRRKATVEQAQRELLDARAAASGAEVNGQRASESLDGPQAISAAWDRAMRRAGVPMKKEARL